MQNRIKLYNKIVNITFLIKTSFQFCSAIPIIYPWSVHSRLAFIHIKKRPRTNHSLHERRINENRMKLRVYLKVE